MNATALIAEDEPLLAQGLRGELRALWPGLDVVAIAANGLEAQREILRLAPDVAFLDVRMPGASGLEVAQAVAEDWSAERLPPLLAFVTAYEEFAVPAFEQAAVDYVLKPVNSVRLRRTVDRLQARLAERRAGAADASTAIDALAMQLGQLLRDRSPATGGSVAVQGPLRMLRAGVGDTVKLVKLEEVAYLQAADKYIAVLTAEGELLIRESLRELAPRLGESFIPVHRSTVVNLDHSSRRPATKAASFGCACGRARNGWR